MRRIFLTSIFPKNTLWGWVAVFCMSLSSLGPSFATSVLQITFPELCQRAASIIEGHVTHVDTHKDAATGFIWTRIRLDVIDNIHGPVKDGYIELMFLGGSLNDLTLKVSEMHIPEMGETGVYFIESLTKRRIHPFVGWSQGHFIVEMDANGQKHMHTHDYQPIINIEDIPPEDESPGLSRGLAAGVKVGARYDAFLKGMDIEKFKDIVKENLFQNNQDSRN